MTLTWRPWAALLLASSALAARADIVTLSFESAGNLNRLADYYNGGYNGTDNRIAFDQALYLLYRSGRITLEEAMQQADSANNLRIKIKMEDAGAAGVAAQEAEGAAIPGPNALPPTFTLKQREAGWAA